MNIKEFVDEFKKIDKEDDKKAFVKKHITKTYIPYSNKMLIAQKLAEITTYTDAEKRDRLRINTNLRHAYLGLETIALYTDIEVKFEKKDENDIDVIFYYDMLNEVHLDGYVQRAVGEDFYELDNMVSSAVNDIIDSQSDIGGIIKSSVSEWVEQFTEAINSIDTSQIANILQSDEYQQVKNKIQENN